jgi:hypothetical protein
MIERDLLLNATGAVLLAVLAWHHPALARHHGRWGLALFVAGALLPFVDTALYHAIAADRIDLLTRPPLLQAPLFGLLGIGVLALLAGVAAPPRLGWAVALRLALGVGAGYAAHIALSVLTPVGWPLWAPFSLARASLPILPGGHPPLLLALLVGLALAEALPRRRPWIATGAAALAGVYVLTGALQYTIVAVRARALATPAAQVHVYPDGDWLLRWQVVLEAPERYELSRHRVLARPRPEPRVMPRWNDQAVFLKLLGDPVVNRFYFRVFHHPVVRLDVSGSQITLLMQELQDQSPLVPGPTFYLESDLSGRNRFYQLQRFN